MDHNTWEKFVTIRERFRRVTQELESSLPGLKDIQQNFINSRADGNNSYTVETPVVYNTALDDITIDSEIKLILVADNPGRREQAAENRRYLVGPSGKIAQKFFRENPVLGIDFIKNVIILNKTPIHSPRTNELRELCRLEIQANDATDNATSAIATALYESQKTMADLLLEFHLALEAQVWIVGYSEMKKRGIFESYIEKLKELYCDKPQMYKQLFFFRHFSMNQFTIDLKKQALPGETVIKSLNRIGSVYRQRVLGTVK
jgi:hypothetical protein